MIAGPSVITPAERRRMRVRGSIIAAAERVFSREGEAGLSIRRLAEEIDYSPSAIYKYFGSKEELIDELKEAFFERLLSRVDRTQLETMPFEARSLACLSTYIDVATERPHHYAAAFSSVPGDQSANAKPIMTWADFCATRKGQAFDILLKMVAEGQASGHFDPDLDRVSAARSVWASLHGLAQLLIHLPSLADLLPSPRTNARSDFVNFHAQMILRSLRPFPVIETDRSSKSHVE